MQVLYSRSAGLDVHQKTVVACVMITQANGKVDKSIRTFATTTAALLALAEWLASLQVTHVAMESTGVRLPAHLHCVGRSVRIDPGQCS